MWCDAVGAPAGAAWTGKAQVGDAMALVHNNWSGYKNTINALCKGNPSEVQTIYSLGLPNVICIRKAVGPFQRHLHI